MGAGLPWAWLGTGHGARGGERGRGGGACNIICMHATWLWSCRWSAAGRGHRCQHVTDACVQALHVMQIAAHHLSGSSRIERCAAPSSEPSCHPCAAHPLARPCRSRQAILDRTAMLLLAGFTNISACEACRSACRSCSKRCRLVPQARAWSCWRSHLSSRVLNRLVSDVLIILEVR